MPDNPSPKKKMRRVEHRMRLTIMEALFAGVMVNLVAGILLIKLALEMGATGVHIGLLASFPFMSQVGQIPAIIMVQKLRKRKFVMLIGSALYRLCLFGLIFVPWMEDKKAALSLLVILVFVQNIGGGWSAGVWNGWIRDLIPSKMLGRTFGLRMNWYTLAGTLSAVAAAITVDFLFTKDPDFVLPAISGFFAAGFVASLVSFVYLVRLPAVPISMQPTRNMLREFTAPFADPNFRRLMAFLLAMLFSMNLAVPFFPVYMLDTLNLSVTSVTFVWALGQFMQVPFFKWWGFVADRFSHTTSLATCLPFFIVGLLLWPFTTLPEKHMFTWPLLIIIHILLGIGLAGVILSSQVIALKLAPKKAAASYMATATMLSSLAAASASILGGWLAEQLRHSNLTLTIRWTSPEFESRIRAFDMGGYDFLFVGAAVLIILCYPLLATIVETGKAPKEEVVQLMKNRAFGMFRSVTTVPGFRQVATYPTVLITRKRQTQRAEEFNITE